MPMIIDIYMLKSSSNQEDTTNIQYYFSAKKTLVEVRDLRTHLEIQGTRNKSGIFFTVFIYVIIENKGNIFRYHKQLRQLRYNTRKVEIVTVTKVGSDLNRY